LKYSRRSTPLSIAEKIGRETISLFPCYIF
jgi:hypothetical protein